MKIKWKFIILFSIVLTIGIGTSSYYTLSLIHESVVNNELGEMRTLVIERENQIQSLHNRASEDLIFVLKNPLFVEYFELPETKAGNVYEDGTLQFTDKQKEIKTTLEQLVYHFQNKFDVDETCIIDRSGQEHVRLVLSSIEPDENLSPDEELNPFFKPSFEKNLDEVHIQFPYVSPDTNRWVFAYTSPIVLADAEKPAFYHFEMPISIFQDIVNVDHGRMYVIDRQGYLIADSESYYPSTNVSEEFTGYFPQISKILSDSTFAELMQTVETSGQGTVSYTDDNGDVYHGVYTELPTFGWILLYHENEELMFSEHSTFLGNIKYTISMIIAATFAGTVISIIVISNTITRPLTKLQKHTKNIVDGKLDEKIKIKSNDEVGDLAKSFNHMTNSLKKTIELEKNLAVANQKIKNEKFAFIGELAARLSHDLRNPLSNIKMGIESLNSKNPSLTEEKRLEYIDMINTAISRMTHQLEDVMDFVRIGNLNLAKNSILEIINSSLKRVNIPDSVTLILPDSDYELNCDKVRIEIVFVNLLTNALDTINNKGKIQIRIKDTLNYLEIYFEDSGPGINQDNLSQVFDPLYTTKQHGTGLGLTSCKNIIKEHNGTISVTNVPTTFLIKISKNL